VNIFLKVFKSVLLNMLMVVFLWRKLNIFLPQTLFSRKLVPAFREFPITLLNCCRKPHMTMKISVADPDLGSGAFLTPGPGIQDGQKKIRIRIRDENPESYF
jgi:hypothetical protein